MDAARERIHASFVVLERNEKIGAHGQQKMPDVLRAIERDLRSQYGAEYRVIGSDSPEAALDLLKQLKVRNDSVALLIVLPVRSTPPMHHV